MSDLLFLRRAAGAVMRSLRRPGRDRQTRSTVQRIGRIEREVQAHARAGRREASPVIFVVASSHVTHVGLGAAIGLLSAWAVRLAGHPVVYYVCTGGLSLCVLGSNRHGVFTPPPCGACTELRGGIYPAGHTVAFAPSRRTGELRASLARASWAELQSYSEEGLRLGELCLPSLRWVERRLSLYPDDFTRRTLTEYVASAGALARHFGETLDRLQPRAVVLFNGTHYPEATARHVASSRGIRTITYESGFRGVSAFFSHGVATEYEMNVPEHFAMGAAEDEEMDRYLAQRVSGNFSMAGRRIWSRMDALSPALEQKIRSHRQVMALFTNVTWDTSQAYANALFRDMFEWLEATVSEIVKRPDALVIIRAHPDELRPEKPSRETVQQWLDRRGYDRHPQVVFIPADSRVSSYELIRRAKACLVYNSTVGLEAAALGTAVLAAGRTRYRNAGAALCPATREEYQRMLHELLDLPEIPGRLQRQHNARRFFYYSLFKASLDMSPYVRPARLPHFMLNAISSDALHPERSQEMAIICSGIVDGREFVYG